MNREKIFRWLIFLLFVLVATLLFRFRPRIEGPTRLETPSITDGGVVLSGKNFKYEERQGGVTKYIVTAEEVLETSRVEKELTNPVVVIPKENGVNDRVLGRKGTLSLSRQEVRIYDEAMITIGQSMTISSPAFRLTPQGEVVSEGRALIRKDELKGAADILRYDRERRVAHLEGNVDLAGSDTSFSASRIIIDFEKHTGEIEGPVLAVKGDSRLEAPRGALKLDAENRLQSVTLMTPSRGETGAVSFASSFSDYLFDKGGAVSEIILRGSVSITQKGPDPGTLGTEKVSLLKTSGNGWNWNSPGDMEFLRGTERMTARNGSGTINGAVFTGDLEGPVRGWDESGEFSSNSAKISGESFELVGGAQTVRGNDSVRAERIVILKSGEKKADGGVSGKSVSQSGEIYNFTSDRARMAKSSYPVKLSGNVHIYSERLDFKGEEAVFHSSKMMTACKGASVSAEGRDNPVFLYGSELSYDENAGKIEASGDPSASDGKSRLSAAERIMLFFDKQKKAEKIVAEGSALYESETYTAKGDRIVYFPREKKGKVSSSSGKAVVTEKAPYRLVTGKAIEFGKKELRIGGEKGEVHRGKIEGEELKRKSDAE